MQGGNLPPLGDVSLFSRKGGSCEPLAAGTRHMSLIKGTWVGTSNTPCIPRMHFLLGMIYEPVPGMRRRGD